MNLTDINHKMFGWCSPNSLLVRWGRCFAEPDVGQN